MLQKAGTLKADKDVVIAAVEHCGRALRYASDTLRADKKVVIAAITNDGYALEYASKSLRSDSDVGYAWPRVGLGERADWRGHGCRARAAWSVGRISQ